MTEEEAIESGLCINCGHVLTPFREGSSCGFECLNCGKGGWATTYSVLDPIQLDENTYEIFVFSEESPSVDQIRAVSEVIGKNFLQTQEFFRIKTGFTCRWGNATEVKAVRDKLEAGGVRFQIEPDFPW